MKKIGIIILILIIGILYFIGEGRQSALNIDGTPDKNMSLMDAFFRGITATFEKWSYKETTSLVHFSNFALRSIIK